MRKSHLNHMQLKQTSKKTFTKLLFASLRSLDVHIKRRCDDHTAQKYFPCKSHQQNITKYKSRLPNQVKTKPLKKLPISTHQQLKLHLFPQSDVFTHLKKTRRIWQRTPWSDQSIETFRKFKTLIPAPLDLRCRHPIQDFGSLSTSLPCGLHCTFAARTFVLEPWQR